MPHFFISYAKRDTQDLALQLRDELCRIPGVTAWMDESLESGESWASQIQQEIDKADYVVVLISPDVNRSTKPGETRSFVLNEIDYAQQDRKPIIPIMAQYTKMPVQIAGIQYIDLAAYISSAGIEKVVQEIRHKTKNPGLPQQPKATAGDHASPRGASPAKASPIRRYRLLIALVVIGAVAAGAFLFVRSTAGTGIVHNTDWARLERDFNDVAMVQVPAGCFEMGNDGFPDVRPESKQCIETPFWISKYEVTNAEYQVCVNEGACIAPDNLMYFNDANYADYPVVYVNWKQANDYATWQSGRLPTEKEWEYAGRGPDDLIYPWGDEWNISNLVWGTNGAAPVGRITAGKSWVGALDMIGNVWEWTSSWHLGYPYDPGKAENTNGDYHDRVLRGGSWDTAADVFFRLDIRLNWNPALSGDNIGFRFVRAVE